MHMVFSLRGDSQQFAAAMGLARQHAAALNSQIDKVIASMDDESAGSTSVFGERRTSPVNAPRAPPASADEPGQAIYRPALER